MSKKQSTEEHRKNILKKIKRAPLQEEVRKKKMLRLWVAMGDLLGKPKCFDD